MNGFISFAEPIKSVLEHILESEEQHAKWLNTLSFLENCGARKIAACEHPTMVKEEMLKHASEEFRHAHHLKKQIAKIFPNGFDTYAHPNILGGISTLHYLRSLDLMTSRYLKAEGFSSAFLKEIAYLLVTYVIELRAGELYHIYDQMLRKRGSRVTVKSILLEEKGHLDEMKEGLQQLPLGLVHACHICQIESTLCEAWLKSIKKKSLS